MSRKKFLWRIQESSKLPHTRTRQPNTKAVEKLCPSTALSSAVNGKKESCMGYFWRLQGSNAMPTIYEPIKKVHLRTGELLDSFPLATEAANYVGTSRRLISNVLKEAKKFSEGFFLGPTGSTMLPPNNSWRPSEEIPIEKLCLETGKILESFKSYEEAANSFGVKPSALRKVLERKIGEPFMAYFWRLRGSNDLPTDDSRRPSEEPIEKLCSATGEVLECFVSITEAAESVGTEVRQIRRVLRGKQLSCRNFFWRTEGSSKLPRHCNTKKPVEQLCPVTWKVLGSFPSMKEAANSVGASHDEIRRVLKGEQRTCRSSFWRPQGSTALPLSAPNPKEAVPVEMICQRSGKLLESYKSTADAARSVGATPSCIWSVVSGTGFSCKGFYWRRQGSNKLPPPDPTNRAKPIEQVSLATGEVLECFESIYQALKSLGVSSNSGGINGVLNKRQKSAHGYYWRPKGSNAQPQAGAKPHTAPVAARRDANPIYCYLLRSANLEHPQKTYIGITKDPLHRLDQHNGHKRRGAKKTRIGRPWEIVMVIQGFKSRTTALRFEYAWQRFDRSLKVRGAIGDAQAKKLKRQRGIQGQLCMLKTILTECSSSVLEDRALTLNFLEKEFLAKFDSIEPSYSGQELPDNIELKTVDSVERIVEALKKDDPLEE